MANRIFKYICDNVKAIPNEGKNTTTFRVVGIPYGGPNFLNGKDLQGEFFAKDTDYGRDEKGELIVKTLYAYYDHALRATMKEALGSATFKEDTDDGLVYEIEVSRSNRYHDMLVALAEKKVLGVSSQPVQTSVEIDLETGKIKRWHPVELSFTPMPANPLAVVEVMKSFNIDDESIAIYTNFAKDFDEIVEDEEDTEDIADNTEDIDENALSDEIDEMFDVPSDDEVITLVTEVKALIVEINSLKAELASLKEEVANGNKEVVKNIIINRNGIKSFASKVARDVKLKMQQEDDEQEQMSDDELEAQKTLNKKHSLPGPKGR